jgi:hypothetical protein
MSYDRGFCGRKDVFQNSEFCARSRRRETDGLIVQVALQGDINLLITVHFSPPHSDTEAKVPAFPNGP